MKYFQIKGHKVPKRLTLEASSEDVKFTSAEEGKPKIRGFSMVAYTGGAMQPAGFFDRVVVDLAGMRTSAKSRPILLSHDTSKILGHTEKVDVTNRIHVSGKLSAANDSVREVSESADNGFPWQASIGASIERMEYVEKGKKAAANGRSFDGPVLIARRSFLQEISFVPLGADDNTSAKVAASQGEDNMPPTFEEFCTSIGISADHADEEQMKAARSAYDKLYPASDDVDDKSDEDARKAKKKVKASADESGDEATEDFEALKAEWRREQAAETKRVAAIRRVAKDHDEICAKAIEEGWTTEKAELEVLRASRPTGGSPAFHMGGVHTQETPEVITAALLQSLHYPELESARNAAGVREFDDKTLQAAWNLHRGRLGLQEFLIRAAHRGGYRDHVTSVNDMNGIGILKAAFSTLSLPGILSNVMNKFVLQGFMYVEQTWSRICRIRPVSDFKAVSSYRLNGDFEFEELGPNGEIKHGTTSETSYSNQARTYAKMYGIPREDIINDDLGALAQLPSRIGRGGGLKLNDRFWVTFNTNTSFFTAGNTSLISGAGSALGFAGLSAALPAFRMLTDPDSKFVNTGEPAILLVPPALEVTARQLMSATETRDTTATKVSPTANIWREMFRVEVSRYLQHASYGNSSIIWYLLSEPTDIAVIEGVFLNGMQTPTVETAEQDFNLLGIQIRGYFDFGFALQEYRGGIKSAGT